MQNQELIKYLIEGHDHVRTDCPACGGSNSFSVSRIDGGVVFHCYRQSCGYKGRISTELSKSDIVQKFVTKRDVEQKDIDFVIPEHFIYPLSNQRAATFMDRWNIVIPYTDKLYEARYDIRQDRFVFIIKEYGTGRAVRGAGRSLSKEANPRWLIYGNSTDTPFLCGKNRHRLLVVEDCISAVRAAGAGHSGCALLGTAWNNYDFSFARDYGRAFVCLDPDASKKSFQLAKELNNYTDTTVKILEKDLKYYTEDEVKELFK